MKEREVPGLMELKIEYESKLVGMKDFQELKSEFEKASMSLIKEVMRSKGIKLESGLAAQAPQGLRAAGCGFCEVCITACTDCVAYS